MKRLLIFFFFAGMVYTAKSQLVSIDSLKEVVSRQKEDTSKVQALISLCYNYLWSNPDSSWKYSQQALTLSRELKFQKGEITVLHIIGETLSQKGNYTRALEYLLEALKICEKAKAPDKIALTHKTIGNVYYYSGNYRKALDYYFMSLSYNGPIIIEIFGDVEEFTNGAIGEAYFKLNMPDSALPFLQRAYELDQHKTGFRWPVPHLFIGHIQLLKKQYSLALEYYRLSASVSVFTVDSLKAFLGIATVFTNTGMVDSAIYYSKFVIERGLSKHFLTEVTEGGKLLTSIYKTRQQADSALKYQEIMLAAKDSLFSQESVKQLQNMSFNEQLRQEEIIKEKIRAAAVRKQNLQYAAIALGAIIFLILFLLLSHSVAVNKKLIRFLGVLALLIVFEFVNLFLHPYLDKITNHSPPLMLLIMVLIAALLIPLHHRLEKTIIGRLVEKNNKIRLAAAKKAEGKIEPGTK